MKPTIRNLDFYLDCFQHLRCAKSKGIEAPHKPILLIAITRLFAQKKLSGTRISINDDLETMFLQTWQEWVRTPHRPNLGMPFYHLRGEAFGWELSLSAQFNSLGNHNQQLKSLGTLKRAQAVAHIHPELSELLQDPETNLIIHDFLIQRYFKNTVKNQNDEISVLQKLYHQLPNNMMCLLPSMLKIPHNAYHFIQAA